MRAIDPDFVVGDSAGVICANFDDDEQTIS